MKRQIRFGVFETNSSSVHSLTIVSKEEYEKFKNDELRMSWKSKLIDSSDPEFDGDDTMTYESYGEDYEWFESEYTTKSGETVVAFGYYGENYQEEI